MKQQSSAMSLARERILQIPISLYPVLSLLLFFPCKGYYCHASNTEIPSPVSYSHGFDSSSCFTFRTPCVDSTSLCLPLAREGAKSRESSETGNTNSGQPISFRMSNGGSVTCSSVEIKNRASYEFPSDDKRFTDYSLDSCQAPLIPDNWMKASNGVIEESKPVQINLPSVSSLSVQITPPVLDWGTNTLYSASLSVLTVTNLNSESSLLLHEPFSTDPQFYVLNYKGLSLGPGENVSIPFVFLPRVLGSSSAHVVLQTSLGGFIIQAKGIAVESPYKIEPLLGFEVPVRGVITKNLSIYNPFEDSLYVEEVAVWITSSESVNQSDHIVCRADTNTSPPSSLSGTGTGTGTEWYSTRSNGFGLPSVRVRSHEQWEVFSHMTNPIIEFSLWSNLEGKVFGAICMKFRNGTTERISTVVVPLEIEVQAKPNYSGLTGPVSASFDCHVACDGEGTIFSLYLKNEASQLLSVLRVFEESGDTHKVFDIRSLRKLVLFPGSLTAVALLRYASGSIPSEISEISDMSLSCNLVVETNFSASPFIKIPCRDFVHTSPMYGDNSRVGFVNSPEMKPNLLRQVEANELLLTNWASHGTESSFSLLTENDLSLPPVHIGTKFSQFITVQNPSPNPTTVQLILNSHESITDCKSSEDSIGQHTFLTGSPGINSADWSDSTETRFGFSLLDQGLTESYIEPFGSVSLGPVWFRPSARCTWSSSVLLRNNLSGLDLVQLSASGGSHSISLLEGSEPVWKLDFDLSPPPAGRNLSNLTQSLCPPCDHKITKDIYVKNTGELPFEVRKIRVSGTECRVDGFSVGNTCRGFGLKPGESAKLVVSYRPHDFASKVVQRDLEFALASGIFMIPMKATVPACMISQCWRAPVYYWRVFALFLLGVTAVLFVFFVFTRVVGPGECYLEVSDGGSDLGDSRPFFHHRNKANRSIAREQKKNEGSFVNSYSICQNGLISPKGIDPNPNLLIEQKKSPLSPTPIAKSVQEETGSIESPQNSTNNLTIKVVRERGRRRKRKGGNNSGLAAKFEVSSSHSGNSTPSSPLSPNSSTPKQVSPKAPANEKSAPAVAGIFPPPSVFLGQSVNSSAFLAASSPIAPHARAPGSNLTKERNTKREESEGLVAKEFTYDIWADHFSGHVIERAKEISTKKCEAGYSNSFFAIEPRAPGLVPRGMEVTVGGDGPINDENSDVTGLDEMK